MDETRQRQRYRHFTTITTRWHDNDLYGHVNNVIYYGFFDSAVNRLLVEHAGLDIHAGPVIALVVSSNCQYHASVAFPQPIEVGLAISRLGNSSVHYQLAVFREAHEQACATGNFVHVFVDRDSRRPTPIPSRLRQVLSDLLQD
ncbi:acyl-CoA thioesterase [Pseudomonas guariconensis]|uniref:acyl-CoA thioesterase n=1 Tax=Pseudomonas guariconensis TaxID=1288410 RepID=UPI0018AC2584|nr:thioesterase family protein [Pseudomonas guariconensis]MBF8720134.1 acyl-CoA thioesterase [Pseudomonas guariconensis]MBF8792686.1 acyl-CoA thioesterase [Pseudomonas monteilii]